jgi:septal ring factor EnvC (AmiA/AmiB activator)
VIAVLVVVLAELAAFAPPTAGSSESRLTRTREEIRRLRAELDELVRRERGVLGELERLGAELRLREAEHREVSLRLGTIAKEVEVRNREIATLAEAQEKRRNYLSFRLREMYKRGPEDALRRLVGGEGAAAYLQAMRYAAYLSERDGRILEEYRENAVTMTVARNSLQEEERRLTSTRLEARQARSSLERSRAERERLLERIRDDATKRRGALAELEAAAAELTRLAERPAGDGAAPALDVTKFKGLLDWPAPGGVSTGFGDVVHPRFKTIVPHPGLDIDASHGDEFVSVFDGTVIFAAWLNGYGLTVLVDHGGGLVSIYAHASVIVVAENDEVARGQALGLVGDTGSLRGPFLYFEIRRDGQPVDPATWLRPR